jgi:hypothetical protein
MKALLFVFVLFVLIIGFFYFQFPELFQPFIGARLNRAAIEKDFVANLPTIFRTPGGNLELAGVTATETFMSSDTARLPFFNFNIPGATTTVIIIVPVVYRYFVPLLENWDIKVSENTCVIYAPELRPMLPPAIQSDKMQIKTFEGPLAFDAAEQQTKLLQGITPQLEANAKDSTRLKLVREEARKTVAEFIQAWLLARGEWGQKKIEHLEVYFRDEAQINAGWQQSPVETPDHEKHD